VIKRNNIASFEASKEYTNYSKIIIISVLEKGFLSLQWRKINVILLFKKKYIYKNRN